MTPRVHEKTELRFLEFLSRSPGRREHFTRLLLNPDGISCRQVSPQSLSALLARIEENLSDDPPALRLLELHLLSSWLIHEKDRLPWLGDFMEREGFWERHLPGLEGAAPTGAWTWVPVLLSLGDVHVRHFVAGCVQGRPTPGCAGGVHVPPWALPLMEEPTLEAIETAAAQSLSARERQDAPCLCCYPLTLARGTVQFTGTSLGLPLALAFSRVLSGARYPGSVAATGGLGGDGEVTAVGSLQQKARAAQAAGYTVFFHPSVQDLPERLGNMDCLPVGTLDEALVLPEVHTPGRGQNLRFFYRALGDPQVFLDNWARWDPHAVQWAFGHGRLAPVVRHVLSSRESFLETVDKAQRLLKCWELERVEAMAALLPREEFPRVERMAPLALFRWCLVHMSCANHRGKIREALRWGRVAERLSEQVRAWDVRGFYHYHVLRLMVAHNAYLFDPRLPEPLEVNLRELRDRFHRDCVHLDNPVDESLGQLCGAVSQNYGFCGPDWFDACDAHARLAQKAFGCGAAADYAEDWRRPLNYRFYALLDKNARDEAEPCLLEYLDMDGWASLPERVQGLSPWQHAALARFMVRDGRDGLTKAYLQWAWSQRENLVRTSHPWQLWCWNLGRVARKHGDLPKSLALFRMSLDLIVDPCSGPTVRAMALLPLAGLWKLGKLPHPPRRKELGQMLTHAMEELDARHFAGVRPDPLSEEVLRHTWSNPASLFPFSYR